MFPSTTVVYIFSPWLNFSTMPQVAFRMTCLSTGRRLFLSISVFLKGVSQASQGLETPGRVNTFRGCWSIQSSKKDVFNNASAANDSWLHVKAWKIEPSIIRLFDNRYQCGGCLFWDLIPINGVGTFSTEWRWTVWSSKQTVAFCTIPLDWPVT